MTIMKLEPGLAILLAAAGGVWAQEAAREIPVPRIRTSLGELPGPKALPLRVGMPEVLVMNDGRRVTSPEMWAQRRQEMRTTLSYYAVGLMPPPPGNVTGEVEKEDRLLEGKVHYRLVRLRFGPERKLELRLGLFTPAGAGPFPAIILQGGTPPGAVPLPRLPQGPNQGVFRRGWALAVFSPNDCAGDTTLRNLDGSWAFPNTGF